MQERNKKILFKLQPSVAWRQLNGKKEDIEGEFTNEKMLEYIQSLYMHDGMTPMFEKLETPCITCIDLEDVNKGTKKMANGKVVDVTLITSELLKWTMPSTRNWIMIIEKSYMRKLYVRNRIPNTGLMESLRLKT